MVFVQAFVRLVGVLAIVTAVGCVDATNPFDPDAPASIQAPATIVGRIRLVDTTAASPAALDSEVASVRVTLVQDREVARDRDGVPHDVALDDVVDGAGAFTLRNVVPGTYNLRIDNVGSRFNDDAPVLAGFTVLPGQNFDVGEVLFRFAPAIGEVGPGSITGEVALNGAAGGPRTVRLFRLVDGVMTEIDSVVTDAAGGFAFATGTGQFAVSAELTGFTPDYAVDLAVGEGAGQQLSIALSGADALRLNPVTAVLVPAVPAVEGVHYVNGDAVDLNVLAFGGVTGMRLSTSASLVDAAGVDLPFSPHAATTRVSLPDVQGPITIHAQFEARTASGFIFLSPTFTVDVVRDTTPPRIEEFAAPSLAVADDGVRYVTGDDDDVGLRVDAFDEHSAIRRVLLVQPADNVAPTGGIDTFTVVFSPGGLARIDDVVELSPGEGEKVFFALVADRAGNVSAPATLRVVRDTSAPTLPLAIAEATGQLLRERDVTAVFTVDGVAAVDLPVLMRVGPQPLSPSLPLVPFVPTSPILLGGAHDDVVIVAAELHDAAGNVAQVQAAPLRLSLVADVAGSVIPEGIPGLAASAAGTAVTLRRGATVVASTTTSSTGAWSFAGVPEGSGYRVEARRPGHSDVDVTLGAIVANTSVDGGVVTMPVARGTIEGRFLRADRLANPTGHGLILVTATLTGSDRVADATAVTTEDGAVRFIGVPSTLTDEAWVLAASADGYARVEAPPATVAPGATTIVADQQLAPLNGEFDVCAPTGACNPLAFSNLNTLRVRLRDATGVTAIRASAGSPPAGAFAPFDAGTPVLVDVSAVGDGNVSVFVQTIVDGVQGVPLEAVYVRDTVAPTVTSFSRLADDGALDSRFTNDPTVGARLDASAGAGTVSPLVDGHLAFAATAPATPPVTATRCVIGDACQVPLPSGPGGIVEGLHTLFAFACDAAGNCAPPVSASVIFDDTPPSALHGVGFTPVGTGVVSFAGGLFTRSSQYPVRIDVGQARDGAGLVVVDDQGAPVRDVFGYRFSLVEAIPAEDIKVLSTNPAAGGTELVDGLALPPTDGLARVFALFVDAAGNTTPVEPNPFSFQLTLDTSPPQVSFSLDNGAATSTDSVVAATVTPGAVDPPVRAQFTLDGGTFTQPLTPAPVALPLAGANATITLPVGDGPRTVHARFFDAAGNVAERSASITVDATAPVVTLARCASCTISDGVAFTNAGSRVVTIDVAATDVAGAVTTIEVGVNGGARVPQANTGSVQATLQNLTTPQAVQIVAVDVAGNRSAVTTVPITLDVLAPTSAIVLDGVEGTATATASLSATDQNGVATMRISTSGVFAGPQLPFSSPVQVDLPGGVRTVSVELFDRAGNRATSSATLPTATLVVAGGATSTRTTPASVQLTVPASPGPVQFVVDDTLLVCAGAAGFAAAGGTTVNTTVGLDGGDGPKTVSACVRDGQGNTIRVARGITLDTVGPQNAFVFIDGGAAVSLDRDVSVTIAAPSDAVQMAVGEGLVDCAAGSTVFGAVSTTSALTLAPGVAPAEGDRTVSVCLKDAAGNTARFTDSILVDTFDPTGTLKIDADGDAFVRSTSVTLFVEGAANDVTAVAFANGALSCASALFQPFSAGVAFALPAGDGSKTIAGCLRDRAGRTTSIAATVTLDTVAPAAAVVVNGGAAFSTSPNVTATVTGEGASGTTFAAAAGVLDCTAASFTPFDGSEARALTLGGVDGVQTVSACVRDAAGNTTLASTSIVLDRAAPDALLASCATCAVGAGGAFVTNTLNHLLEVEAIDDGGPVALTRVSVRAPNGATVVADQAFGPTASLTLAALDGTHTITVSFIDGAGLVSGTIVVPILLDRVAPTGTIVLAGTPSASLTRTLAITAQVTGASSDAATMAVSNDSSFSGAAFVPFTAAPVGHSILPGDGSKQVFVRLRDVAGNESANLSASITLDQTPPAAPTVLIASGAAQTRTVGNVVAYAAQGATEMRVSIDGVFDTELFGAIVASRTETFAAGDGLKTVFVIFRDAAGNETAAVNDSIVLDRTAPTGAAVAINGGDDFTRSASVTLSLDAVGADLMRIATDGNPAARPPVAFSSTAIALLPGGDGKKTIDVIFEDFAGNQVAAGSQSITLDTIAPSGPQIATSPVRTTAGTTDPALARPFPVSISVPGSDTNGVVHQIIGGTVTDWTTIAGGGGPFVHSFTLPREGVWNLGVRAVDGAGNISAEDFITIQRDNTGPAAPTGLNLVARDRSVALRFNAVPGDVAGYRVFYGTNSASSVDKADYDGAFADQGASPVDIGNNTSFTLTGLPNNTGVSIAIEAYDTTTDDGGLTGSAPNRSPLSTGAEAVPNAVTPRQVSSVAGSGSLALFAAIGARGDRLYTNLPGQTFRVYDVSDPGSPVILGSTAGFAQNFSMSTWGKFAYLSGGSSVAGIRAVNVEVGRAGAFGSTLFSNGVNRRYAGFAPTGRFGYGAATNDAGGATWNLVKLQASTDLASGVWSESSVLTVTGASPTAIDATARRVVVGEFEGSDNNGNVRIFSTSPTSTAAPTLLASIPFDRASVRAVKVVGRRAYVGLQTASIGGVNGLAIIDITNGILNSTLTGFDCIGLTVAGRHVYCSDDPPNGTQGQRLVVVDVGVATNPTLVGRVLPPTPSSSEFSALVTAGSGSIFGVEISGGAIVGHEIVRPTTVTAQGSVSGNYDSVAIDGPIAYVAGDLDNGGVRAINLGVAGDPSVFSTVSAATLGCAGGEVTALAVQRHYVAAALDCASGDGIAIIDYSDQFAPVFIGTVVGTGGVRRGVSIYGNTVFAMNDFQQKLESFRLWHIEGTEAAGAVFETSVVLNQSGGGGPVVQGGVAYVQGSFGTLLTVDVSDPDNSGLMSLIGTVNGAGTEDVIVGGPVAWVTRGSGLGIRTIDLTNLATPTVFVHDATSAQGAGAFLATKSANYLFVRNDSSVDGFRVVDTRDPTNLVLVNENRSVPQGFPELGDIDVEGTIAVIGTDGGGVQVLDLGR